MASQSELWVLEGRIMRLARFDPLLIKLGVGFNFGSETKAREPALCVSDLPDG